VDIEKEQKVSSETFCSFLVSYTVQKVRNLVE